MAGSGQIHTPGPTVKFARFTSDGQKITLFSSRTDELDYIAVSHVWGNCKWRSVSCLDHDILASNKKVKFIEEKLFGLVGTQAFWFDTITVNQRVLSEVIATKQAMSSIFRYAEKTLVVREGDGLYSCCEEAVRGFGGYGEFIGSIHRHAIKHIGDAMKESYLKRLWTLQECLLSHTLQFTTCGDGLPSQDEEDDEEDGRDCHDDFEPFYHRTAMTVQGDALYTLAAAFYADGDAENQVANIKEFMAAYLQNGTIQRSKPTLRRADETIFNNEFVAFFSSSTRAAATPQDYIFATMPQFPWYQYPAAAATMTWNQIFMDLYEQATKNGKSFTARFTQSMIQPSLTWSQSEATTPSTEQPKPECLGDFLKLLGRQWELVPPGTQKTLHLCSESAARSINYEDTLSSPIQPILTMIENAMEFAPYAWARSFQGGELSGRGSFPYAPDLTIKTIKMELDIALKKAAPVEKIGELGMRLSEAREEQLAEEKKMLETDDWVTTQCMRILSLWYRTMGITEDDAAAKSEWAGFRFQYSDSWHTPVRETLTLMAATISCQIPLSALEWVRSRFIPIRVRFKDGTEVLALLAKHAAAGVQAGEDKTIVVAGRHTSHFSRGTDLVLADVQSRLPVGILPDFIHHVRQTRTEKWNRLKTLYGPLLVSEFSSPQQVYRHIPLDVPAGRLQEPTSTPTAKPGEYLQIKARPHEVHMFSKPAPTNSYRYQYWSLQQKGWFRVLVIEPSLDRDERISCSLLHRPLVSDTRFVALSYTWGTEEAEYPILIDGSVFFVRRNLYCALRELRGTSDSRTLWIDAVCINQDDISERGFQVAQMGDIYSLAERVTAWLGEGNEYSDLGFDAMAEYFRISNAACKSAAPGTDSSDSLAEGLAQFLALPNMDNRLFGIVALYIRPWWRRIWTAQEIGLAREIEVQYGSRSITWEKLHKFATVLMLPPARKVLDRHMPRSEMGQKALRLLQTHTTLRAYSMEDTRRQLRKGKLSLSRLVEITVQRSATDPRDKIYGLLGMANNDPALQPDYTLSVAEVYTAATKAMVLQHRDLRAMSFLTGAGMHRQPNLPSWAVDFENLEDAPLAMMGRSNSMRDGIPRIYAAAPTSGPDADFAPEFEDADRVLRLKGVALDIVHTIGDCTFLPGLETDDVFQVAPNLLWSTVTQWKSCVTFDQPYLAGEKTPAAFWKTVLIGKRVAGYHSGFSGTLQEANNLRLDKNDGSIPPRTLDEEKRLVRILASSSGLKSHLWGRRFAVSEKGYFALLPGTAKTEDVLCILVGGEMPYVLRPLANGRFQILGECYVHGMMDGEIAEGVENGAFAYRIFALE